MEMAFSRSGLGRCVGAFWLAVIFDILGLATLLVGVFANLFFYDFLIYAGSIVIFFSLIWWVFWYTGNIEVPVQELEDDVGLTKRNAQGVFGLIRRLSTRVSQSLRQKKRVDECGTGSAAPTRSSGKSVVLPMALVETSVNTISASLGNQIPSNQGKKGVHIESSPI
ncbi:transmembrane protein 238-like [Latimeria chalumnae]|uniref:Si:dkeyp-72e1.6 n=1 Tax=Latimeria chalumnae TaxID=7897 RepID=M3XL41_LATCH